MLTDNEAVEKAVDRVVGATTKEPYIDFGEVIAALTVLRELEKRKPRAHPTNHGNRCWWCRWMATARADLDALKLKLEASA